MSPVGSARQSAARYYLHLHKPALSSGSAVETFFWPLHHQENVKYTFDNPKVADHEDIAVNTLQTGREVSWCIAHTSVSPPVMRLSWPLYVLFTTHTSYGTYLTLSIVVSPPVSPIGKTSMSAVWSCKLNRAGSCRGGTYCGAGFRSGVRLAPMTTLAA